MRGALRYFLLRYIRGGFPGGYTAVPLRIEGRVYGLVAERVILRVVLARRREAKRSGLRG